MSGSKGGGPPTLLGGTAIKPVERKGLEAIRYFLHNPDTGEFFTRTPKSWFLITVFYLVYYSLLAAFWYGLLMAFFSTLPSNEPKWTLDSSIIGSNPGVGLRPGQQDARIDSSLILIDPNPSTRQQATNDAFEGPKNADWAGRLGLYFRHYEKAEGMADCESDGKSEGDHCIFDYKSILGDCATPDADNFGYLPKTESQPVEPCLILKPNRLVGWTPTNFEADYSDIPEDVPENVVEKIKLAGHDNVIIDCQGEQPFDVEGLGPNNMEYFPRTKPLVSSTFRTSRLRVRIIITRPWL